MLQDERDLQSGIDLEDEEMAELAQLRGEHSLIEATAEAGSARASRTSPPCRRSRPLMLYSLGVSQSF